MLKKSLHLKGAQVRLKVFVPVSFILQRALCRALSPQTSRGGNSGFRKLNSTPGLRINRVDLLIGINSEIRWADRGDGGREDVETGL